MDRFAQNELFELRGPGEQGERVSDQRDGLVVPEAAVQVQFFQVRQRGNTGQLILEAPGAKGDPDQIERADAEIGGGKLVEVGDRPALSFQYDSSTKTQRPLGDDAVGRSGFLLRRLAQHGNSQNERRSEPDYRSPREHLGADTANPEALDQAFLPN